MQDAGNFSSRYWPHNDQVVELVHLVHATNSLLRTVSSGPGFGLTAVTTAQIRFVGGMTTLRGRNETAP